MKTLNTPSCQIFGLLTLFSISAAAMAGGKPFKPVGVKAWTSGSETFIRARPSADVPPVAKVARHTPLYVWGKYNGWYRVETHDHIFGWVFNPYINAPKVFKVREMPRSKARVASNRTANQTMYGTPEVLKKHFATYGAKGALDGLKKHGIYLASASKPASPKPRLAATTRVSTPKLRPRLAAAPRPVEKLTVIETAPVKAASPVPIIEKPNRLTTKPVPPSAPRVAKAPRRPPLEPVPAPALGRDDAAPRSVEAAKIAGASRDLVPSARQFARAAGDAASQPSTPLSAPPVSMPPVSMPPVSAPPSTATAAVKPAGVAPAPRAVVVTPAPRAVVKPRVATKAAPVKKVKKPVAKATPRSRYATRKARQREQLRLKMGLSPAPMPPTIIAPVSPAELLRAREQYLNERKARLNAPASQGATQDAAPSGPQIETPVGNLAPLPPPTGPLGGPSNGNLPPAPPTLQPMALSGEFDSSLPPLYPILADPRVVALSQIKPKAPLVAISNLAPLPGAKTATPALRGGSIRGGSPRDRFGAGMANQALSYRGMPYIRGAASPRRGFDCSGLVYFLLRQRGYNPPRTAAGYRHWGQSVPRGAWQPGDLVLFANTYKRGISHIGVYLGENKFVHAATSGTGVRVSSLNEAYYRGKYFGARRAVK